MSSRHALGVAIVTGAGRGIGRAVAVRLAASGLAVVFADSDKDGAEVAAKAVRDGGGAAVACVADVSRPQDAAAMVALAARTYGHLDVLVNCAGILRSTSVDAIKLEEWDLVLRVNLTGAFLCAQAAHSLLRQSPTARIVNIASMAGRATSTLGGAHYTASKAGVLGLTRHLAREWAADGITVNAVSPGIVDTGMIRAEADDERLETVRRSIPMGRFADPGEIASLVAFLASSEAAYITGANIDIHGGELIIA